MSQKPKQQKLSDIYGADVAETENGTWLILRPGTGESAPLRVKLRSIHSKVYRREDQKLDKKFRVQYIAGNGFLDPETQDEKEVLLASRALLVGWEGFLGDDGKDLPFTPQVVQETLRAFAQLRRELFVLARMDENFRSKAQQDAERDELAKN